MYKVVDNDLTSFEPKQVKQPAGANGENDVGKPM